MGRKIAMRKIEGNTRRQVTFSKRRDSLLRKAQEVSVCCDVDVALLAFSPSGRISHYCNHKRVEDLLTRYTDLPADKRLSEMKDIQSKTEKLKQLDRIRTDEYKEQHLRNQIENLELQVKKNQIEVQVAEANLRNFELGPEHEISLQQLAWCEKNLVQAMEKLNLEKKGKMAMENQGEGPPSDGSSSSQLPLLPMEFDPWKNNPNFRVPGNIFEEMLHKGKGKAVGYDYGATETALYNHSAPKASTYAMNQSNVEFAPETFNAVTYVPSQINAGHCFSQQYPQLNYGYDMAEYQLWQQTQTSCQQVKSNPSFGAFVGESSNTAQNYQSNFPQSSNYATANFVEAYNYWWTSMGQIGMPNQKYTNPHPVKIMDQPNMAFNSHRYGSHESGNGNNGIISNSYDESDSIVDEMIVSPSPSDEFPPPSPGV